MKTLTLNDIQLQLPWTIKYSIDFRSNPQSHKDFSHAITHAMKAIGKLSAIVDDLDHHRECGIEPDEYMADLVICALRMATTYPGRNIDLNSALIERIESKNGVKLK